MRTVRGVVVDKSESVVPGGVVFLKNLRTNQVKAISRTMKEAFGSVGSIRTPTTKSTQKKDGAKSPNRQVSSFDNRKEMVLTLKLDKKKD